MLARLLVTECDVLANRLIMSVLLGGWLFKGSVRTCPTGTTAGTGGGGCSGAESAMTSRRRRHRRRRRSFLPGEEPLG
jgi:hypothetical protein